MPDPVLPDPVTPGPIIGREDVAASATPEPEDDRSGTGHPLPASEKARHGSIPESIAAERGHGAN